MDGSEHSVAVGTAEAALCRRGRDMLARMSFHSDAPTLRAGIHTGRTLKLFTRHHNGVPPVAMMRRFAQSGNAAGGELSRSRRIGKAGKFGLCTPINFLDFG